MRPIVGTKNLTWGQEDIQTVGQMELGAGTKTPTGGELDRQALGGWEKIWTKGTLDGGWKGRGYQLILAGGTSRTGKRTMDGTHPTLEGHSNAGEKPRTADQGWADRMEDRRDRPLLALEEHTKPGYTLRIADR